MSTSAGAFVPIGGLFSEDEDEPIVRGESGKPFGACTALVLCSNVIIYFLFFFLHRFLLKFFFFLFFKEADSLLVRFIISIKLRNCRCVHGQHTYQKQRRQRSIPLKPLH